MMNAQEKAIYDRVEKCRSELDQCLLDLVKIKAPRPTGFLGDYLLLSTDITARVVTGEPK